ncbi:hypothetical protein CTI14_06025 [Methylobacterium radiotolerans]|nr:hypothetical protein CTI14_06025 [Methylobacterium radiotolerans]
MLMESILFGRQSIGQSGTGFAEQIESYGAGECADTDQEFADKILKFIRSERSHIYDQAEMAREVYINDVTKRYMTWMGN